jgi:hypothetical protein
MDDSGHRPMPINARERMLPRLAQLVASGRLTVAEADRVRNARNQDEFEDVARDISARHQRERMAEA